MKVNGWQVSPEELEEKILTHPNVVDCAIVGHIMIDKAGLEQTRPRAYVVLKHVEETTPVDIYEWVARQTVSYKHLKGGVLIVANIPHNASGKILRRLLVQENP